MIVVEGDIMSEIVVNEFKKLVTEYMFLYMKIKKLFFDITFRNGKKTKSTSKKE